MSKQPAALILAGGGGARLWPLSKPERPKPFIPDFPVPGPSLIEQTISRLQGLVDPERIFIVTNPAHQAALRGVLPDWPARQLVLEPAARNTAAAIAYALAWIQETHGIEPLWAVLPADHRVERETCFRSRLGEGFAQASSHEAIITLGVQPTHPSTQFGYIKVAPTQQPRLFRGLAFREKPSQREAQALLAQGDYLWNAGLFIGSHSSFVQSFRAHSPEVWSCALRCVQDPQTHGDAFAALPKEPFDRAVMEKLPSFGVIRLDAGWNDVGQWHRAGQALPRDEQGNGLVQGSQAHSVLLETHNCSVWNRDAEIALVGTRDLSVIVQDGRILIVAQGYEDQVQSLGPLFPKDASAESADDLPRD